MKDRADFARKGIARGRSVVVVQYADGILFVSENPSPGAAQDQRDLRPDRVRRGRQLQRVREPPDRRRAAAPTCAATPTTAATSPAAGLANAYAQTLGTIFSSGGEKPYEVEIFVAEVGDAADDDQIYRLTYDGQVADEHGFAVMGGAAERIDAGTSPRPGARGCTSPRLSRSRCASWGRTRRAASPAAWPPSSSRWRSWTAPAPAPLPPGPGRAPRPAPQRRRPHRRRPGDRRRRGPPARGHEPADPASRPGRRRRVSTRGTRGSSGSRTSTASPARSGGSAA